MHALLRALALATALILAPAAWAVTPAPDGRGQVLIYPYYTVRNAPPGGSAYNTLVSIVNSGVRGKAVKLRVHEGKAGATVFEANVFLSAKDVWTAAIVPSNTGAGILSRDRSCTRPTLAPDSTGTPVAAGTFTAAGYAGDPLGASSDRVREGFIEVVEMGIARGATATAITHVAGYAPCDLGDDAAIAADLDPPTGGLYGSVTLVNVGDGTAYGYDAVALDQWSDVAAYGASGSGMPTLAQASPPVSIVSDGGKVYTSTWPTGLDAVDAALGASSGAVEYMREVAVKGATDVVVTMPTRQLAVDSTRALAPFNARLGVDTCEVFGSVVYSRDEQLVAPPSTFPESPPEYQGVCSTTTVMSLDTTRAPTPVLGSFQPLRHFVAGQEIFSDPSPFPSGVVELHVNTGFATFALRAPATLYDPRTGLTTAVPQVTYTGLPMIGVAFVRYVNGTLDVGGTATLSNYGANSTMRMSRSITIP